MKPHQFLLTLLLTLAGNALFAVEAAPPAALGANAYPADYRKGTVIKEIPKEFHGLWQSHNQSFRRFAITATSIANIDTSKNLTTQDAITAIYRISDGSIVVELKNDSLRVLRVQGQEISSAKFTNQVPGSSIIFSRVK